MHGEKVPFAESASGEDPKSSESVPTPAMATHSPLYAAGRVSVRELENMADELESAALAEKAPPAVEAKDTVVAAAPSVAEAEPDTAHEKGAAGVVEAVSEMPVMATSPKFESASEAVSDQRVALEAQEE